MVQSPSIKATLHIEYWTVLCYHPYLVSMLFADLLSLHLVTFLMFFVLVVFLILQEQVWYFISKNQPGLWMFWSLKSSPGSHSLFVNHSVDITSSCLLLAFTLLVGLVLLRLHCRTCNCARLLIVATQSSRPNCWSWSKVAWQQCT